MGTHLHSDLTRPIDATPQRLHWPLPGAHRAPGQPILGQTEAVVAELGSTELALVMIITLEDADDAVYLASAPCPGSRSSARPRPSSPNSAAPNSRS